MPLRRNGYLYERRKSVLNPDGFDYEEVHYDFCAYVNGDEYRLCSLNDDATSMYVHYTKK